MTGVRAGTIVVISDRIDHTPATWLHDNTLPSEISAGVAVVGSYLERLPLALIACGRFAAAEVWHHVADPAAAGRERVNAQLSRRGFPLTDHAAPFDNAAMAAALRAEGPPELLIVFGLGVSAAVLEAAAGSVIVYNSIDAPALRVPRDVAARFDMVLAGAPWQADEIAAALPGMPVPILPVGPEFASPEQFFPLNDTKDYDLIYVGAAQPYKRHDLLFDTIERLDGSVNAVCVFGYGELAEDYRAEAARRRLPIDFVMPPPLPFPEVNRWMNRARIGVVAGVDDGAPAILTEYMLAGLPVLANAGLCCGLQYIRPETGEAIAPEDWAVAIPRMLARLAAYRPRQTAIANWSWPHSAARFLSEYDAVRQGGLVARAVSR